MIFRDYQLIFDEIAVSFVNSKHCCLRIQEVINLCWVFDDSIRVPLLVSFVLIETE